MRLRVAQTQVFKIFDPQEDVIRADSCSVFLVLEQQRKCLFTFGEADTIDLFWLDVRIF